MSFDNGWALILVVAPVVWMLREWPRTSRHLSLLLKGVSVILVALALAEPTLNVSESKVAVAVLADTSAGLTPEDLARASGIASKIEGGRGRHWVRVMPFARSTRPVDSAENSGSLALRHTAGEGGQSTDLETAVREASAALPEGLVPRIALVSDGNENRGSVARAAWQAQRLGIPIDTFPLAGRTRPQLRLESVALPPQAFAGERFSLELLVSSPRKTRGTLEVTAEGRSLGTTEVQIEAGENRLNAQASLAAAGAVELGVTLRTSDSGDIRFNQAIALRRPRMLFVNQDPEGADTDLVDAFQSGQFEVVRAHDVPDQKLDEYQLIVLNNIDMDGLPESHKTSLERFAREGGGLLAIGGEKNVYVEKKPPVESALDKALPARLAPPRSPEGTCIVLIVDKSSSMEGRKMELARLAAIGVINNLRPIDMVGVLIFDNSFQWAVPIRKAEDRTLITRLVAGITPDGGTQIAPALAESYRKILPTRATFRHIVLLTDGISEEGDSINVAREAATQRVTISTVGLGQDVNRAYLEKVASFSKGKSYFLIDPSGLEQILLKDVMEHTGSTAIEKPVTPQVTRQAEILEGVEMAEAPPLKGYVKFISKESAETILTVDDKDPLLARWQYGLGRAAVFASDAKRRWAERWVNWPGFDRFWANVARDLLPHSQPGEARIEFDPASGSIVVEYRLGRGVEEPKKVPDIFILGPDNFRQIVPVAKAAAGLYRGRVPAGDRKGFFRVRPLEDSRVFPEVGLYRQQDELLAYGANEQLLKQVAQYTGGRYNPSPDSVFDAQGRAIAGSMRLWPALLGLAVVLNLAELAVRKLGLKLRYAG
ncbi:MAG: VWA domain-containing protein [Acidobacteria bacterium]|nr:VWA domain-containing protein [Acidobacteriota bacterium]